MARAVRKTSTKQDPFIRNAQRIARALERIGDQLERLGEACEVKNADEFEDGTTYHCACCGRELNTTNEPIVHGSDLLLRCLPCVIRETFKAAVPKKRVGTSGS